MKMEILGEDSDDEESGNGGDEDSDEDSDDAPDDGISACLLPRCHTMRGC